MKIQYLFAAALILSTSGCAQLAANRAAAQAERDAQLSAIQERYNTDPAFHAAFDRARYAQEYCANLGSMTNATTRGLVAAAFAGGEVQASCIDFYARTGHLPGQAF